MDYQKLIENLTPEIYQRLKQALEVGKWPDGIALSTAQKVSCMDAVISWESQHVSLEQRTGYIDRGSKSEGERCGTQQAEQVLHLEDKLDSRHS
jgi:hypothetical protein